MATAHAKPVQIALVANIVTMVAAAAFVPNPKQKPPTISAQLKAPAQQAVYMWANVKRLPRKGRGVKEAVAVMAFVGNMGGRLRETMHNYNSWHKKRGQKE